MACLITPFQAPVRGKRIKIIISGTDIDCAVRAYGGGGVDNAAACLIAPFQTTVRVKRIKISIVRADIDGAVEVDQVSGDIGEFVVHVVPLRRKGHASTLRQAQGR